MSSGLIRAWFELHPHLATEKGYPGLDERAPSFDQQAIERFCARLADIDGDGSLDGQLLKALAGTVDFPYRRLKVLEHNPVFYLKAGLDALESLELRYDQPPWKAVLARLEGLTPLLAQARTQLTTPQAPAVEVALEMAQEAIDHLGTAFGRAHAPERVARAADEARRSVDHFAEWLDRREQAGFQPMGQELFRELLAAEHLLDDPLERWQKLATKTLAQANHQLERVEHLPDPPPPSADFGRAEILAYYRDELETVRRFVVDSELVSVPEGTLHLVETPDYLEPLVPGAFYLEPALFAGDRTGRFFLPSIPDPLDEATRLRYARRIHWGGFRNLVVHEAYPGHHLQFLHAGLHFQPLRNLRDNDVMLEGWALYCEGMMEEAGLYPRTPFAPRLYAARMRALRVLVDIGIHTGELTLEAAVDLMAEHLGDGARGWIASEVRRYALEPSQAMSYLVGAQLILELREALAPRDLKAFHDKFLSFGPIPIPLIRQAMLREAGL